MKYTKYTKYTKYMTYLLILSVFVIGFLVYQNISRVPCTPVLVDLTTIEGQVIKECKQTKDQDEIEKIRY